MSNNTLHRTTFFNRLRSSLFLIVTLNLLLNQQVLAHPQAYLHSEHPLLLSTHHKTYYFPKYPSYAKHKLILKNSRRYRKARSSLLKQISNRNSFHAFPKLKPYGHAKSRRLIR